MKISFKNIALGLGIIAGAAVAAAVISNKPANLISSKTTSNEEKPNDPDSNRDKVEGNTDDDVLYI